ncbi:MAG: amino acid adenylation domain-containing protein, partial [Myxococcaceae bacterium]
AFGRAVNDLIVRHEALRSTVSADGLSLMIGAAEPVPMPLHDWSGRADQEALWNDLLRTEVETTFDLQKGPLFRAHLVKTDPSSHRFVFTAHHIVCDGWSAGVITRELGALYSAAKRNAVPDLPPAEQWSAYAKEQAQVAAAPERSEDEKYWTKLFSDDIPVLELPVDRNRPPMKTYAARRVDVPLTGELIAALKKTGAKHRASLFSTLLGGFQALMMRLAGQEDVVVGIPSAGQAMGDHPHLVGHAVNTLPIRGRIAPTAPFAELLELIRVRMLEALEHQQLTYGTLLKSLPLPRDASRLPLVSVCFNVDRPVSAATLSNGYDGLTVRLTVNPRHFETFDIFINAVEEEGGLTLQCQYNTDLLDESTVRRWLSGYELLLKAVAQDAQTPVGKLPMLSEQDRAQLAQWNDGSKIAGIDSGVVHALIEAQAKKTPNKIAVEFEGKQITYAQLDARTNQLARKLREAGVQRGQHVGLCVERSIEMIVGVAAILKSGAAYIPLDPGYPAERLQYMVADSKMQVLVTESKLEGELTLAVPNTLLVDQDKTFEGMDSAPLPSDAQSATPEDVAYVIYTSGSTGRPKGVLVPHRAVCNLIQSVQRTPGMTDRDVVLGVTTLSFDIAVSEVLLPLTVGAHIVVASREVASDGARLLDALNKHKVTFLDATPATYRLLLAAGWGKTPGLRVICTGEAMPKDLALELVPRCDSVWNGYGPTETTVWSTFYQVKAPVGRILIGKAVANTQLYVLDPMGNEVPVGVKGELFIGGSGVTHGYLNREDLTKDRFLPDTFSKEPGRKLYKTGDVVRYLPDGNMECLGRNDFQVKLRGFRIELGDIEDALSQHPAVRQAAVIVREDRPGDKRLVAYAVTTTEVTDADLRAHLKRTLPDYMVPGAWVRLPKMPLTPSGKIDRKALPAPQASAATSDAEFVAPRSPTEELVVGLFREALNVPRVSVNDDFFAMGGHSLLASQILARLRRDHGVELSFRKIFEAPTAARFAELVDKAKQSGGASSRPAAVPKRNSAEAAPVSMIQERLWLLEEMDPGTRVVHNLPAAWRFTGPVDRALLERALNVLFTRHESLRTGFAIENGRRVQKIVPSLEYKLNEVDLSATPKDQQKQELERRMDEENANVFDLSQAPLFRATLYRMSPNEVVLYTLRHNAIWDGWSFDIFLNELTAAYTALAENKTPNLPELPVTYADFASWHRGWVDTNALDAQRAYWQKQLAGHPAPLEMPTDRPRPRVNLHQGQNESVKLNKAELDSLTELGKSMGGTLYMVLYSAFNTLLYRWTGQTDLIVGTPVRARSQPELEGLIGPFVNVVILRTQLRPDMTFKQLVQQVKDLTLDAFSHQDVPLEKLGTQPPVVRGLFSLQDARNRPKMLGPAEVSQIHTLSLSAADDFMLWTMELRDGLLAVLNHNEGLFEKATALRFLEELKTLLLETVKDPHQTLAKLRILPDAEKTKLETWGHPTAPVPHARLDARIEAFAAKTPDAPAVGPLTYGKLNAKANALAKAIQDKAGSGTVALIAEPSADFAIALLAALKSGRPVSVFDARQPKARLEASLSTLSPSLLLGDAAATSLSGDVLRVDTSAEDAQNLGRGSPQDPALVVVERDQHGVRKTVSVSHQALNAMAHALGDRLKLNTPGSCVVVAGSLDHEGTLAACVCALTHGMHLEVASADAADLPEQLERTHPNAVFASGRVFSSLVGSAWKGQEGLRAVFLGNAADSMVAELRARKAAVWSVSGTASTGLIAFAREHTDNLHTGDLGKPLANVSVRVVETHGGLAPVLVPGAFELSAYGMPLVHTGERARWRSDGTLQRSADPAASASVSGQRAYPAELTDALRAYPGIQEAAAVAHTDRLGERQWVAYIVPKAEAWTTQTELRRHLREHLPEALVPKRLVEMPELPKHADGSVDLRKLESPFVVEAQELIEPRNDTEKLLAQLWVEVLGPRAVSVHDNFFELGGHSLLCFQLVEKLEEKIGKRVSPRLFLLNTLEQVAQELGGVAAKPAATTTPEPAAPPDAGGGWLRKISKVLRS